MVWEEFTVRFIMQLLILTECCVKVQSEGFERTAFDRDCKRNRPQKGLATLFQVVTIFYKEIFPKMDGQFGWGNAQSVYHNTDELISLCTDLLSFKRQMVVPKQKFCFFATFVRMIWCRLSLFETTNTIKYMILLTDAILHVNSRLCLLISENRNKALVFIIWTHVSQNLHQNYPLILTDFSIGRVSLNWPCGEVLNKEAMYLNYFFFYGWEKYWV